jgi:hypothetical protein
MNKSMGPVVVVLALGVAGFLLIQTGWVSSSTPVSRPAAPTLAQLAPAGSGSAASAPGTASAVGLNPLAASSAIQPVGIVVAPGTSAPASDTGPEWIRNPPNYALTRALQGDQAVSYDGRARTVLGTRPAGTKEAPTQPMLLVRDETSGQVDYFQSGLQFKLKPGTDFEAFIQERSNMVKQFANADYATVMVDAAAIAAEFKALQSDPRVTYVAFLKTKVPAALR